MRVITGAARGCRLQTLEGNDVRPTTERVKEAMFSAIQFDIEGRRVLDLFAGSGQLGIEALSRGAESAVFIDNSKKSLDVVKCNLAATKFTDKAKVIGTDYMSYLSMTPDRFDIVFMDPPYNMGHEKKVLSCLKDMKFVTEDTVIIVEAALDTDFDYAYGLGFEVYKEKRYKTNKHVFLRRA